MESGPYNRRVARSMRYMFSIRGNPRRSLQLNHNGTLNIRRPPDTWSSFTTTTRRTRPYDSQLTIVVWQRNFFEDEDEERSWHTARRAVLPQARFWPGQRGAWLLRCD